MLQRPPDYILLCSMGTKAARTYILDSMGCGVAFLDYDNDGWQDIVVLTAAARTDPTPADGDDSAVSQQPGRNVRGRHRPIRPWPQSVWATGITVGDYDNDGFDDIFITCWGQNILFHNDGKGVFSDVTEKAGLLACRHPVMAPAAPGSTTIAMANSIFSSRTISSSITAKSRLAGRSRL